MLSINITESRQHLPEYLKQVQVGDEAVITVHGKAIVRIVPDRQESECDAALKRLKALRGTVIAGDILYYGLDLGCYLILLCQDDPIVFVFLKNK